MLTPSLENKYSKLLEILSRLSTGGSFAVAFSGGLDSRFLAFVAARSGFLPILIHARGPHVPLAESAYALQWAAEQALGMRELYLNPLDEPKVASGDVLRCYFCKRMLFTEMLQKTEGLTLCDGTQVSDSKEYRPGMQALRELGVRSPLAEAGLSKAEIRTLGAHYGMCNTGQKARPCLLTRFNYGLAPSAESLSALGLAEEAVARCLAQACAGQPGAKKSGAWPDFRLRFISANLLELHVLSGQIDLTPELQNALRGCLDASALPPCSTIVETDSLSGYFDRRQSN